MSEEPQPPKAEIVYRYLGPREDPDAPFFTGVPRRDLTAADVAALPEALLEAIVTPGPTGKPMYEKVGGQRRRQVVHDPGATQADADGGNEEG